MEPKNKNFKILHLYDADYYTTFTQKFENRKTYTPVNENHIYSYIPGIVHQIMVKTCQYVEKGDTLFILDSMKMLNKIRAPKNGILKYIYIKEGDCIPKNYLVMEYEDNDK